MGNKEGGQGPEQPSPAAAAEWLMARLRAHAERQGFSQIGVADVDLSGAEPGLLAWLAAGFHGSMDYMARHGLKRARPAELLPGTVRVVSARMNYLPPEVATSPAWREHEAQRLADPQAASISLYARGRDYHKVLRQRLQHLADALQADLAAVGWLDAHGWQARVFTDSAPVLEVELASRSGLGWRGKHTLTLAREAGSFFFLGEIYVNVPLPLSAPVSPHCGQCQACLEACPTGAIVAPYRLDARRCISYLTIEHAGPIPVALRPGLGNRIYGCDDCQRVCPWNKYAQTSALPDFAPRPGLADATLLALWAWTEPEFLRRTEGSPIRRIGHERWRRNLAVAMGNAVAQLRQAQGPQVLSPGGSGGTASQPEEGRLAEPGPHLAALLAALQAELPGSTPLVAEHITWALAQAQG